MKSEDYSIDDYISNIDEMLAEGLKNNNYLGYSLQEIGKMWKEMSSYAKIVKKKAVAMKAELTDTKIALDNEKQNEEFIQKKYFHFFHITHIKLEMMNECRELKNSKKKETNSSLYPKQIV